MNKYKKKNDQNRNKSHRNICINYATYSIRDKGIPLVTNFPNFFCVEKVVDSNKYKYCEKENKQTEFNISHTNLLSMTL